jgi:hypothetical protein
MENWVTRNPIGCQELIVEPGDVARGEADSQAVAILRFRQRCDGHGQNLGYLRKVHMLLYMCTHMRLCQGLSCIRNRRKPRMAFAQALLAAGARKVYAAARHPERITLDGVNRVRLDVTKPDDVAATTRQVKAGLSNEVGIYLNFDPDRTVAAAS